MGDSCCHSQEKESSSRSKSPSAKSETDCPNESSTSPSQIPLQTMSTSLSYPRNLSKSAGSTGPTIIKQIKANTDVEGIKTKAAVVPSKNATAPYTPFDPSEDSEEPIDPRVQVELENLNTLTELINKLERELDDSRNGFRTLLSESSNRLKILADKLGSAVEKSRPYYDARIKAKELQNETQKAVLKYERAMSAAAAAKEMVKLSEEGLVQEGRTFDPTWQEMLNHATARVNAAEEERIQSEGEHRRTSIVYMEAEKTVQILHAHLKKSIEKSRPYYEMKAQFNQKMDEKVQSIKKLEAKVTKAKADYSLALHRLEGISSEIHEKRKLHSSQTVSEKDIPVDVMDVKNNQASATSSPAKSLDSHFQNLHLSSSTPIKDSSKQLTAVVHPYIPSSSDHDLCLASSSSVVLNLAAASCLDDYPDSDGGSIGTVDTLDDIAIDHLMRGSEIESQLNQYILDDNETKEDHHKQDIHQHHLDVMRSSDQPLSPEKLMESEMLESDSEFMNCVKL